jgi:3-hydroxyisobutyrate dehydrogenase-like beta-hydroxyacid dehydrogenase
VPVDDLVRQGATESASLRDLAAGSDAILICVGTSRVVEETIAKLVAYLRRGMIVLDAGTSEPQSSRRIARELKARGIAFADIPVTGGPEQAEKGELGVLCGADTETFARIGPLLACFATTIRHMGPVGSGHTAKLISNYLVTGMVALVTEAFRAARKAGIDWRDLYDAMLNGSGNSGVLRKMVAPALAGDFDGYRFSLANAAKDIDAYAALAEELGCATRLSEAVAELFAEVVKTGHGGRNVSHLLDPAIDDVT